MILSHTSVSASAHVGAPDPGSLSGQSARLRPSIGLTSLRETKILGCISIIRPLAKRFVKFCNRGGSLPQFHVNHTETVVHRCFRIEPRSFQVVRFCTFEVAFQITRPAEIIMPFGMVRFALQRSLELSAMA